MQSYEEALVFEDPSSYVDGGVGVFVVDVVFLVVEEILNFQGPVVVVVVEDAVEDAVEEVVVAWDVDVSALVVEHGIDLEYHFVLVSFDLASWVAAKDGVFGIEVGSAVVIWEQNCLVHSFQAAWAFADEMEDPFLVEHS